MTSIQNFAFKVETQSIWNKVEKFSKTGQDKKSYVIRQLVRQLVSQVSILDITFHFTCG